MVEHNDFKLDVNRELGGEPNAWTTGQAALALLNLGSPWNQIEPSIKWLLGRQSSNGGCKELSWDSKRRSRARFILPPFLVFTFPTPRNCCAYGFAIAGAESLSVFVAIVPVSFDVALAFCLVK